MRPIRTFMISPRLPKKLKPLEDLAHNLRWSWSHSVIELFRRLDSELWEKCNHNPLLMLGLVDQNVLESAVNDEGFLSHMKGAYNYHQSRIDTRSSWFSRTHTNEMDFLVAYFSAEFGLTECLSIFAGGLGVLAGDYLKSASNLGIPMVGIGLLYQQGYFQQHLNEAGWQQEVYGENDFYNLPLQVVQMEGGIPLTIAIPFPGRDVFAQVWKVQVGRVTLYLLDTNIPTNLPEDRSITYQLYGGDSEMRIKQEMVLGIGGFRTLEALHLQPTMFHMNEGHSAFLSLELIRWLMKKYNLHFTEAREIASVGLMVTVHTPVPAGHDYFSNDLMHQYFSTYTKELRITWSEFLALGRINPYDQAEQFCMTILALRLSHCCNGVSKLHEKVTQRMFKDLWPGVPEDEIPIGHVTNGVHFRSWISREMNLLYDRYLGPRWQEEPGDKSVWEKTRNVPREELWRTHERRRERLVAFVRQRLRSRLERLGASRTEIEDADEVLDSEVLTIGFARRFATYKRATLILHDPERLSGILNNSKYPVQIIFAGKAHPRDEEGKKLIQQIDNLTKRDEFKRKMVFIEDYDMSVARYLVQGSDLWLNTPRRLMEASGTSGMKASANGVLNLSILDGWWDEAYDPSFGWAIMHQEGYNDPTYQDKEESEDIYDLLEQEIAPIFYDRGVDRLPRRWIDKMKDSIANLCYFFNTNRMILEYTDKFYMPASRKYKKFISNDFSDARELASWKSKVQNYWPKVKIESVKSDDLMNFMVLDEIHVQAVIRLGKLTPDDVSVEICMGQVDARDRIITPELTKMTPVESLGDGKYAFEGSSAPCRKSGQHGFTIRVLPYHPYLSSKFIPGHIIWAQNI
ncbi:MAG: alpha-glucan family phosphorylase [Thermodesulfobacteriota bacterium]|nr:alpha-glucan family phosphorylase [Thermodesulfobacteriota bacterium]